MNRFTLFFLFLLGAITTATAQNSVNLLFESGKANLSTEGRTKLLSLIAQGFKYYELNGHTDIDGSVPYNQDLSMRRNKAVAAFLLQNGVSDTQLHTNAFGETHPLASNTTDSGKQENRRVEVVGYTDVLHGFSELQRKTEHFYLKNQRDTIITAKNGTRITIPKGSFATNSNALIDFKVEEYYNSFDMLMGGLTTTAGKNMLETGGMIFIAAQQDGKDLTLAKPIGIEMPRFDNLKSNFAQKAAYQLFNGEGDPHQNQNINWTVSATTEQFESGEKGSDKFEPFPYRVYTAAQQGRKSIKKRFVPDGIVFDSTNNGKIGDIAIIDYERGIVTNNYKKGWVSDVFEAGNYTLQTIPKTPELKTYFKEKIKNFNYTETAKIIAKYKSIKVDLSVEMDGSVDGIIPHIADTKDSLAMVAALQKWFPITESKYSPLLRTWVQINFQNIKSAEIIAKPDIAATGESEADFLLRRQAYLEKNTSRLNGGFAEYFLFQTTSLGWVNCDRFYDVPQKVDLIVQSDEKATFRVVFKDYNSIMNCKSTEKYNKANRYEAASIPKGVQAYVVGLLEKDGKAMVAFKEVVTSDKPISDLQFELATPEKMLKLSDILN